MDHSLSDEELLKSQIMFLKQCIEGKDYQESAKVAARIAKICKRLRPDYDYSCNLGEFERIMTTLAGVDYGVGKYLPKVVW